MRSPARWAAALLLAAACHGGGPVPAGPLRDDGTLSSKQQGGRWGWDFGVLSPDRTLVAVVGEAPQDREGVGIAAHGKVRTVTGQQVVADDVAWLPDSRELVLAYQRDRDDILAEEAERFAVIDTDGRVVRDIAFHAPLRAAEGKGMTLAPDGRHVVLGMRPVGDRNANADLVEVDLTTGAARTLMVSPDVDETGPSFLPDGRVLVLARRTDPAETDTWRLEVVDLRTRRRTPVSADGESPSRGALLPGPVVVYALSGDTPGLRAVDLRTGRRTSLPDADVNDPTADPDGHHVLGIVPPHGATPGPLRLVPVP